MLFLETFKQFII